MANENRIEELEELVSQYRESYYNGNPEVSDDVFDALEDELRALDPDNAVLSEVGAKAPEKTKWKKKSHVIPMGSLNKANSMEDMSDWLTGSSAAAGLGHVSEEEEVLFWSEKMDGISIALQYVEGELVSAITRGDGQVGENILANVVLMRGAPRHLDRPTPDSKKITGTFRGEIVLTHDFFGEKFSDYSNPRNAASGLARVESREKAKRCEYLSVYVYEAFVDGYDFANEFEKYAFIEDQGFNLPNHGGPTSMEGIKDIYEAYEDGHRDELFYDIDGLVIRYHHQKIFDIAGERSNRPYGAVALKFAAETAVTTLTGITWQVGNTGRITPVAEFEPVELVGAQVTRASLYNVANVRELGIWPGDDILVKRANDVIPCVEKVVAKYQDIALKGGPSECPVCDGATEMDGEHLVCVNPTCDAKVAGNVKAWIDALDLLDWGEFVIDALVEEGKVSSIADLYELEPKDIAELKNSGGAVVGMKTAKKLLKKLDDKREITLDLFIGGLNISMSRGSTIRLLMKAGFDSLESLVQASVDDLSAPHGMADKKANALHDGLAQRERLIERLLEHVTITERGGPLKGKSFCFTGSLSKSRKVIEKMVKNSGGEIKKSASSNLSYLVCNDKDSTSSKAKKARKNGTPLIGEEELYEMMGTE